MEAYTVFLRIIMLPEQHKSQVSLPQSWDGKK